MIGKKLIMLKNGQLLNAERSEFFLKAPQVEEWKEITIKHTKKHGYSLLVMTIRLYFRSSNFLKSKYQEVKEKIKEKQSKREKTTSGGEKEINSFLKMVSEYKNKIRRIKEQVKEEENL
jgi:hypothetical protein